MIAKWGSERNVTSFNNESVTLLLRILGALEKLVMRNYSNMKKVSLVHIAHVSVYTKTGEIEEKLLQRSVFMSDRKIYCQLNSKRG